MRGITQEHPNYNRPSKEYISDKLEFLGYEGYFPEKLFNDLLNLCAYGLFEGDALRAVISTSGAADEFKYKTFIFFNSILFDFYTTNTTPLEMAVHILKDLAGKIDFRSFEAEDNDFEGKYIDGGNEEFLVNEEDKMYFTAMETTLKPKDFKQILKCVAVLREELSIKGKGSEEKQNTRLSKVKDFLKSKKSEWVKPLFTFKVLTKSLPVRITREISEEKNVIVLMEDASSSMGDNLGYLLTKTIQRLLLEDDRILHYYRYAGNEVEMYELNTLEDKLNCFSEEKPFYTADCNYKHLFKTVLCKYKRGDVIIVTDGQDNIPNIQTSMSINCIECSPYFNVDMKTLCKSTGGKYIKIN